MKRTSLEALQHLMRRENKRELASDGRTKRTAGQTKRGTEQKRSEEEVDLIRQKKKTVVNKTRDDQQMINGRTQNTNRRSAWTEGLSWTTPIKGKLG